MVSWAPQSPTSKAKYPRDWKSAGPACLHVQWWRDEASTVVCPPWTCWFWMVLGSKDEPKSRSWWWTGDKMDILVWPVRRNKKWCPPEDKLSMSPSNQYISTIFYLSLKSTINHRLHKSRQKGLKATICLNFKIIVQLQNTKKKKNEQGLNPGHMKVVVPLQFPWNLSEDIHIDVVGVFFLFTQRKLRQTPRVFGVRCTRKEPFFMGERVKKWWKKKLKISEKQWARNETSEKEWKMKVGTPKNRKPLKLVRTGFGCRT